MSATQPDILCNITIANENSTYYAWPTIAKLSNGELLVVVYEGEAHTHSHGKVVLYRSSDNGETWSSAVVCNTILDDRDPGIMVTTDDTIIITSRVAWWKGHEGNPFDSAQAESLMSEFRGGYLIISKDQGQTWSEKKPYPFQPHGPIELNSGKLFAFAAHGDGWAGYVSSDLGGKWEMTGVLADLPDQLTVEGKQVKMLYAEPHFIQLQDGRILVLLRAHMQYKFQGNSPYTVPWNQVGYMWRTFSDDEGRTWTKPERTPIWGFPPHLAPVSSGQVLVTYGRRWAPFGQRAIITTDGIHFGDEIVIRDNAPDSDLGYPASVQTSDGTIATVYYQKAAPGCKPSLMCTMWRLPGTAK